MTPTLHTRRRRQTAREIQLATLRLAVAHGLEAVTTDMISAAAGISPRTFFNYYPNKEAAMIGQPPDFPPAAVAVFVAGRGGVMSDLGTLMQAHLAELEQDRPIFTAAARIGLQSPRLAALHEAAMLQLKDRLAAIIADRLPSEDAVVVRLLALAAMEAVRSAIDRWLTGDAPSLNAAIAAIWLRLDVAGRYMVAT